MPSRAWREQVRRPALAGLPEAAVVQVHRDVAVGIAGRPLDDGQVDVERGDADARGDRVGGRASGVALAGGAEASGGRVMRGDGVGAGVAVGASRSAEGAGSAATGVVYVSRPAASRVTPDAVRSAGQDARAEAVGGHRSGILARVRRDAPRDAGTGTLRATMWPRLSIVAGLVAGIAVAVVVLGGIVAFAPDPVPAATPVPTVVPSVVAPSPVARGPSAGASAARPSASGVRRVRRPVPHRRAGPAARRAPGRRRDDRPGQPQGPAGVGQLHGHVLPAVRRRVPADERLRRPLRRRRAWSSWPSTSRRRRASWRPSPRGSGRPSRSASTATAAPQTDVGRGRPAGPLLDRHGRHRPRWGARRHRPGHHGRAASRPSCRTSTVTPRDRPPRGAVQPAERRAVIADLVGAPGRRSSSSSTSTGRWPSARATRPPPASRRAAQRALRHLRPARRDRRPGRSRRPHRADRGRRRGPGARRRASPTSATTGSRTAARRAAVGRRPCRGRRRHERFDRHRDPAEVLAAGVARRARRHRPGCSSSARARRSRSTSARPTTSPAARAAVVAAIGRRRAPRGAARPRPGPLPRAVGGRPPAGRRRRQARGRRAPRGDAPARRRWSRSATSSATSTRSRRSGRRGRRTGRSSGRTVAVHADGPAGAGGAARGARDLRLDTARAVGPFLAALARAVERRTGG